MQKEYTNGEITIVWQAEKCMHAKHCWKELPEVFNPDKRPWINPKAALSERIQKQVESCPSGALSCYWNVEKDIPITTTTSSSEIIIEENEPILVHNIFQIHYKGKDIKLEKNKAALCRCGSSCNKPFCDGSHFTTHFKD
jgi:uncharacterized Fe-S cluster protein YjdI